MKFSVTSYSFSRYFGDGGMSFYDVPKRAKDLGFDGVEFTDIPGETFEEKKSNAYKIREECEKTGIPTICYSVGANLFSETDDGSAAIVENIKKKVDIAAILGTPVMRHDVCYGLGKNGRSRSFDLMLPVIAQNARNITEYAQTLSIKTCSENHGTIAQDHDRMEKLFNAVCHDNYGLLIDFGNFLCADDTPYLAVSRLASMAFHVHAKDFVYGPEIENPHFSSRGGNLLRGCTIGDGDVDVRKCVGIMKRSGYDGYITVEFEGEEDPDIGISRGLENLRKYTEES